jgi:basic amino acid/polyamine antiporter, APA family
VLAASLLAFLSFGGFDMVAAAGEEVERPEHNLPRAILLTLAAVLGLYLTVTLVAVGTVPAARLGPSGAPLTDAALAFGGPLGRRLILACALLTTAATANAVLVVTSRIVFAMARDRFLPTRLATGRPSPPPLPGWSCPWPSPPPPHCWWPAAAPGSPSARPGSWPAWPCDPDGAAGGRRPT